MNTVRIRLLNKLWQIKSVVSSIIEIALIGISYIMRDKSLDMVGIGWEHSINESCETHLVEEHK